MIVFYKEENSYEFYILFLCWVCVLVCFMFRMYRIVESYILRNLCVFFMLIIVNSIYYWCFVDYGYKLVDSCYFY